ncbi:MAG: hypothetical protein EA413_06930 [Cyanobium sp. PLM2.Bin73]|nr:MAG: hypothetical protein EA413_06930 [Cyanobium sp. PLM2.Bin73]
MLLLGIEQSVAVKQSKLGGLQPWSRGGQALKMVTLVGREAELQFQNISVQPLGRRLSWRVEAIVRSQ